ncbi:MAG: mannose-1-phosphate guanylyltransferase [Anaerolineae bacterium]|nr:mannose-1-phosphate guanylyltransferase [Anaerolineae bacterium]
MDHLYALIMAGGGGTRLWPLSRRDRPKQTLPLTEERTLFEVTVERLHGLIPPDRIYVVTGRDLQEPLRESAPALPPENFILEPVGRDSGPAAGLGIFHIARRDPEAVIAILSADHHIANEERFLESLRCAERYAHNGYIVTLGIHATYPATGFGYIQRGEKLDDCTGFEVFRSLRFTEKPDEPTARAFLQSGQYSWNAGMFILTAQRGLEELQRQRPAMYGVLQDIMAAPERMDELWPTVERISLDYAMMENAPNMAVIPVDIGWSDVGTWATLFEVLMGDENENVTRGKFTDHIQIDTRRTLIVSDRLVVTIGVSDLVIVDAENAILICHRDRAQDVKDVVTMLRARGKEEHL